MTFSAWFTALVSKSNAVFDDISSTFALDFFNDAIILHRTYIRNRMKAEYDIREELTFLADGYDLTLPTAMDDSVKALLKLNEHDHNAVTSIAYQIDRGNVAFFAEQKSGDSYWIEYTKVPNSYSSVGDSPVELDIPAVNMLLEKEVTKSAIKYEDDFESGNAANSLAFEVNNIQKK